MFRRTTSPAIGPRPPASKELWGLFATWPLIGWQGLDPAIHLDMGSYLRHIFLESETAAAVLTCTPGDERHTILTNPEIIATRELIDQLAGTGRLINHSIVRPNAPGELEQLESLMAHGKPAGWKVYTIAGWGDQPGWRLDDEECGLPFLERSRELGVSIVCAHKGLSSLARVGSPADIGPAAASFPDIDFLVYHSGYETPVGDSDWYGSPQPLIDAFRAFQIPEELRQRHGYPELTDCIKEKILGLNAARVYGIDADLTRRRVASDDLSWVKAAFDEHAGNGNFQ